MIDFWQEQRVVLTGGKGFLGSHILERLVKRGCRSVIAPDLPEYNLTRPEDVRRLYETARPTVVIHAAALVGGINEHQRRPGEYLYVNLMMGLLMMEEARLHAVPRYLSIGTSAAYPKHTEVPFREEDLWKGYPDEVTAPYSLAKKMLAVQGDAYRRQYGFNSVHLMPVNMYGPRDHFDEASAHVVASLIRKCVAACRQPGGVLDVWGSGNATREFLYVEDAADGVLLAAERCATCEPINLGSGRETTIRDLATLIARLCEFKGEIRFDPTRPEGAPRRCADISRSWQEFGFRPATSLEDGLAKTIAWYGNSASSSRL